MERGEPTSSNTERDSKPSGSQLSLPYITAVMEQRLSVAHSNRSLHIRKFTRVIRSGTIRAHTVHCFYRYFFALALTRLSKTGLRMGV
jgi:hypothetical protein